MSKNKLTERFKRAMAVLTAICTGADAKEALRELGECWKDLRGMSYTPPPASRSDLIQAQEEARAAEARAERYREEVKHELHQLRQENERLRTLLGGADYRLQKIEEARPRINLAKFNRERAEGFINASLNDVKEYRSLRRELGLRTTNEQEHIAQPPGFKEIGEWMASLSDEGLDCLMYGSFNVLTLLTGMCSSNTNQGPTFDMIYEP